MHLFVSVVALVSALVMGSTNSLAENKAEAKTIKVGSVTSMTGSTATFGDATFKGEELAMKEINAAGGIKGQMIELKNLDDQGKPEEAANAITRLIKQDKVIAVLGEVASSNSLAMAPIAQRAKIPMISPSSTNEKVTEVGDNIFRVCFIDPFQGTVMSIFALNNLKSKTAAIFIDSKSDYSVGLAKHFKEHFLKHGGKIVGEQAYTAGDMDFKSQLTKVRSQKPDVLFVPGYYTEVGLIARQARELGIKAPLLGGDGWDSPKLTEIGQNAINGSFFSNHYSPEDKAPNVQKFINNYRAAYKETPDGLAALGYDSMMMLAEAMKRAKTLSPADIRAEIAKTKNMAGVTGTITLDSKRNPVKSAVVLEIVKGEQKFRATVNPT